jgi:hypothetical protein
MLSLSFLVQERYTPSNPFHSITIAKLTLLFLTLALVAASTGQRGGAVTADDGDLAERRETMAEVVRVFSNPASAAAADSATTHRAAAFMQRELGPLGPIIRAIDKMPEKSAADVRAKEEALDAAQELSMRHFRQLLAPRGSASTVSAGAADRETTYRTTIMVQTPIGPFGIVFRGGPEKSKTEGRDAAE